MSCFHSSIRKDFRPYLDPFYEGYQRIPIEFLNMRVFACQIEKSFVALLSLANRVDTTQAADSLFKSAGFLLQFLQHPFQTIVINFALCIVCVELCDDLIDCCQTRSSFLKLNLPRFNQVVIAGFPHCFADDCLLALRAQVYQSVQILPDYFDKIAVPDSDSGAGIDDILTLLCTGEIPILFAFSFIDCSAGA